MQAMTLEQADTPSETVATETPAATVFTLETLLWIVIALAALGLRMVQLGNAPLSESESTLAYQAWRFSTGKGADLTVGALNPFAFNFNALTFYLFAASDALARVGSVLGGTLLVLAAALFRPLLGRGHALGMALLLALSPSVLFFSRNATGEIWGVLFGLLLVAGVARWRQWGAMRDALLAAVAFGLGLTADGGFWSVLVAGLIFGLVVRARSGNAAAPDIATTLRSQSAPLLVALAVFVLAATGFGTNLAGLGAALNQPVQWVMRLVGVGETLVLPFFFVVLLYELLLIAVGVIGGVRVLDGRPQWGLFAFIWLAVTLLPAALLNSGWTGALLYIAVPLALLGGGVVANLLEHIMDEGSWRLDGASFVVALIIFLSFWITLNLYLSSPTTISIFSLMIPAVGMLIAMGYLIAVYPRGVAVRLIGMLLFITAATYSLSTAWSLNINHANDPREPLIVQPSDINLRTTVAELEQVSTERYRDPHQIPLGVQASLGYAPRWYFREFRDQTEVTGNTGLPEAALLDAATPPAAGLGKKVFIGQTWQWTIGDTVGLLRWLKTRGEGNGLGVREGVLYVQLPQ